MTFNGRLPKNIKRGIFQQPLIGSYSNFKLKLRRPHHILKNLKMKTMEDDLRGKMTSKCAECEFFWGAIRRKLRGNLECGSAQPSLFSLFKYMIPVHIQFH